MTERLAALRNGDRYDFWSNKDVKCPHCGTEHNVSDREWWHLYSEEEGEVECPVCELDFRVLPKCTYTFSTDEQDDYV